LQFCHNKGGEIGYRILLDSLLPVTARLLEDEKLEVVIFYFNYLFVNFWFGKVRQASSMTLVEIAQFVKVDDIGQYVLTIILVRKNISFFSFML